MKKVTVENKSNKVQASGGRVFPVGCTRVVSVSDNALKEIEKNKELKVQKPNTNTTNKQKEDKPLQIEEEVKQPSSEEGSG